MKKETRDKIAEYAWAVLGFILGVIVPAMAIAVSSLLLEGEL